MVMLQDGDVLEIRLVQGHYLGYINGTFIVSGDTRSEVEKDLQEIHTQIQEIRSYLR